MGEGEQKIEDFLQLNHCKTNEDVSKTLLCYLLLCYINPTTQDLPTEIIYNYNRPSWSFTRKERLFIYSNPFVFEEHKVLSKFGLSCVCVCVLLQKISLTSVHDRLFLGTFLHLIIHNIQLGVLFYRLVLDIVRNASQGI